MPSSPEVWPPRVPTARNRHGKGRREGTLRERPPQLWRSMPSEVARRLQPSSRVRVRPPAHPPARATRHRAPPAEGRLGTLPQPTHALRSTALGGHRRQPLRGTGAPPSAARPGPRAPRRPRGHHSRRQSRSTPTTSLPRPRRPSGAPTFGAASGSASFLPHSGAPQRAGRVRLGW